jgi:hypothetical protein
VTVWLPVEHAPPETLVAISQIPALSQRRFTGRAFWVGGPTPARWNGDAP